MVTWEATIKERGNDHILTPTYLCDDNVTKEEIIEFWGLDKPDVEWYKLEKINNNGKE